MSGGTAVLFPSMVDLSPTMLLLFVIAVCAVIMTSTLVGTARDLRRMIRRADRLLPGGRRVLQVAGRTLLQAQRIVERADGVAQRVQRVCEQVCDAAGGAVEQEEGLTERAQRSFGRWFGNGHHRTGAVPRRHNRRGR